MQKQTKSPARAKSDPSSALYAAVIIRDAIDAIVVMDARGVIRDWNPRAEALFGWCRDEIVGQTVVDTIIPSRFREAHRRGLSRQFETGESLVGGKTVDLFGQHRDGHEFPLRLTIWRSGIGRAAIFVGMLRDIPEPPEPVAVLDPQLHEAAQLAELLLESASEGTYGVDLAGRFAFANRAAERMLGLTRDELIGHDMHALVHHSHPDGSPYASSDCPITLAIERGEAVQVDDEVLWTKGGEPLPVEYSASPVMLRGEIVGAVVTFADVGRRQVAEKDLKTSKASIRTMFEDYRVLFKGHPEPMWVYDMDTLGFLDVNDAAVDKYGYTKAEFLAMTIGDIRPHEDVAALLEQVDLPATLDRSGPWRHLKKDGTAIDMEITSHSIRFADRSARVVMAQDVTERRRVERHLERAERLDSIGKLAAGVAHDFNNLLSVIINYAGFVRGAVPVESGGPRDEVWRSIDDDVHQIERAADRATALTQQLLAFARKQPIQPEVLNVNDAVREVGQFLRRTLVDDIELVTALVDAPRPVLMDPGKLEQVLMNLSINAADAMPDGGTLTIATEKVDVDEASLSTLPGLTAGPYMRITVRDTGTGMSEEVMLHAFEPFFTSKKSGEGTGLGLATVYGIVTQAGGEVHIDSMLQRGTTFSVLLPAYAAPTLELEAT
jgi:PAS domain S-box-containing protein